MKKSVAEFLELPAEFCGGLAEILYRCTELAPNNRFQNVAELKRALTNAESRRNFFMPIIFVTTVGIFLSATSSTLPRAEFSPEEKISTPQKISVPSEKISPSFI